MYLVEPKHKYSADLSRTDYLQPIDYARPAAGFFVFGLSYTALATLACLMLDPFQAPTVLPVTFHFVITGAIFYAMASIAAAHLVHLRWLERLKQNTLHMHQRKLSVQIPKEPALELCLAASAQLADQRIIGFSPQRGEIRVVSRGQWWRSPDTQIDFRLDQSFDGVTNITLDAQSHLDNFHLSMLHMLWGDKWMPLMLANGSLDRQDTMLNDIADYIAGHSSWTYQHAIGYDPDALEPAEESEFKSAS